MQQSLVLTVIGPDRAGLIGSVAKAVSAHGGNWQESRLVRLAGQFAGVIHLHAPTEQVLAMEAALRALNEQGLTIVTHRIEAPEVDAEASRLTLELIGHDRPGIVREVSRALTDAGVSVLELETTCFSAPMTGDAMFQATATLHAPAELNLEHLEAALDTIAERLQLDLELEREGEGAVEQPLA